MMLSAKKPNEKKKAKEAFFIKIAKSMAAKPASATVLFHVGMTRWAVTVPRCDYMCAYLTSLCSHQCRSTEQCTCILVYIHTVMHLQVYTALCVHLTRKQEDLCAHTACRREPKPPLFLYVNSICNIILSVQSAVVVSVINLN